MKSLSGSRTWERLQWIPLLLAVPLVLWKLQPIQGVLGHDYYHAFTRFYLGAGYFWSNLFDIPHYTASLCGGMPVFADPQSTYYSLPQWLTFIVDPWIASQLTYVIFYLLGYVGCLKWLREGCRARSWTAHLGALVFVLNGFSFAHLFSGHVTHHSYLLLHGSPIGLCPWARHGRPVGGAIPVR